MQRFGVGGLFFVGAAGDNAEKVNEIQPFAISIHASAWEATANIHKFKNIRRITC